MNDLIIDLNARIEELELQRSIGLTRAAEFAGRVAVLTSRIAALESRLAELTKAQETANAGAATTG